MAEGIMVRIGSDIRFLPPSAQQPAAAYASVEGNKPKDRGSALSRCQHDQVIFAKDLQAAQCIEPEECMRRDKRLKVVPDSPGSNFIEDPPIVAAAQANWLGSGVHEFSCRTLLEATINNQCHDDPPTKRGDDPDD